MTGFGEDVKSDHERWQRIQDLLAGIVGANIAFILSSRSNFGRPSIVTPTCEDLTVSTNTSNAFPPNCFNLASQSSKESYLCAHTLHYFSIPFSSQGELKGQMVVGPVLLGKRENETVYRGLCQRLNLDPENFCDRIRELRVFSYTGIQTVIKFLKEIMEFLDRLSMERKKLEKMLTGFSLNTPKSDLLFSPKLEHLANYLLDIAFRLVEGNSGSVLLLSEDEKNFHVKAFRGSVNVVRSFDVLADQGRVAKYIMAAGKPFLIDKELKDQALRQELRCPEIKSSMVVPIIVDEKPVGALCINSDSENDKFNSENLALLSRLGKLAGLALIPTPA